MKPAACRLLVLAAAVTAAFIWSWAAPVSAAAPDDAAVKKEFDRLYQDYARRFHAKMIAEGESLRPEQITVMAAVMWEQVFGPRKDIVRARAEMILKDLQDAEPISEHLFFEVAGASRTAPVATPPSGLIAKQFAWSPVGIAQKGLEEWLVRLLTPLSLTVRQAVLANAGLTWQVLNRDADAPVLVQRQGPMLYIVRLSRHDDYYQVDGVRWLRPKTMGPIIVPPAEPAPPAQPAPAEPGKPKP